MADVKTWDEVTDEHGTLIDPSIPPFVVNAEGLHRWQICAQIAEEASERPVSDPEARLFATTLYDLDIPTDGPPIAPAGLQEAFVPGGRPHFDADQWRGRGGRWINMPGHGDDRPRRPRATGGKLRSPGTAKPKITEAEIRAAGLDKWPTKGKKATELLGDAKDTFEKYGPEEPGDPQFPEYAADRKAAQDKLIDAAFEGKEPPSDHRPHALFMAGGPASGKSSVLRENRDELAPPVATTVHVDVDKIKENMGKFGMPEYDEMRDGDDRYAATAVHREAGDIAVRMIHRAMMEGFNVIIDGTGNSEPGEFRKQLNDMAEAGYTVDVLYVDKPTPGAVLGSVERAEETGRFVPIPVVRDQHQKVSKNFRDEISKMRQLNTLRIYDESGPVAEMQDGMVKPIDPEKYAAFVAKADEKPPDPNELAKLDQSDPLQEAADGGPTVPLEKWIPEMPHDSSEYLKRRGPWPTPPQADEPEEGAPPQADA